jgi:tetratricopeptide (TPR) repeat protein
VLPFAVGRVPAGELDRALEPFRAEVRENADLAWRELPEGSPLRAEALEILGWAHLELGDLAAAREDYRKHLELFPKSKRRGDVVASLARVHLELGAYDEGIALVDRSLRDPAVLDSDSFPHLGDFLWKLNEAKGDLDGMSRAADVVLKLFPFRMKGQKLAPATLKTYEQAVEAGGFRKAYTLLARGDFPGARRAFEEHVQAIDDKEDRLRATPRGLTPVSTIYRNRSRACLDFIDKLAGKPAPADLELGDAWVTEKRITLAGARGKAVALVFRGAGDERSARFLAAIDRFAAAEDAAGGIELVAISPLLAGMDAREQRERLRAELRELDYTNAAGFDPDVESKALFAAFLASPGGATFLVVNARGEPVWFQEDPRASDVNLARRVLERARDEK